MSWIKRAAAAAAAEKEEENETIATRAHRTEYVEYFLINSVLNVQERTKYAKGENRCENDASSFFFISFISYMCI